ncbi:MarR family transcriptional regulator [Erysipelotrichaceae bacterium 51-3]
MIDGKQVERLLDGCFYAKKLTETLPPLPQGVQQRQNFVLQEVYRITNRQGFCRVSDIAHALNTSMPSITRMVGDLERRGFLRKKTDPRDKRVVLVELMAPGLLYVRRSHAFHQEWAENIDGITEQDVETVIRALQKLRQAMPEKLPDLDDYEQND